MACFHPLEAYQLDSGEIVFDGGFRGGRPLALPCGRCIGCRLVRTRSWAIRCVHEAQMHPVSSFITLTYDDEHYAPSLNYLDFQRFMYRLRRRCGPTRFFMCGEYGEETLRPHFHALLFGRTFPDRTLVRTDLYSSKLLSELWPFGFSSFGAVTMQSAAYVARYCCSKKTGPLADLHYSRVDMRTGECVRVVPEFGHMSLKPGIGYTWFQKYWKEVYKCRDGIVMPGGKVVPPPRYYDKLLESVDVDLSEWKDYTRYVNSKKFLEDCSPARLLDREKCAIAKNKFLKRGL